MEVRVRLERGKGNIDIWNIVGFEDGLVNVVRCDCDSG